MSRLGHSYKHCNTPPALKLNEPPRFLDQGAQLCRRLSFLELCARLQNAAVLSILIASPCRSIPHSSSWFFSIFHIHFHTLYNLSQLCSPWVLQIVQIIEILWTTLSAKLSQQAIDIPVAAVFISHQVIKCDGSCTTLQTQGSLCFYKLLKYNAQSRMVQARYQQSHHHSLITSCWSKILRNGETPGLFWTRDFMYEMWFILSSSISEIVLQHTIGSCC